MLEKLTVTGLTPLELRELEDALGEFAIEETGQVPPDANFPEPTALIVAAVELSSLALTTLAILLARPRKTVSRRLTITREDGREILSYEETGSEIDAPTQSTVDAIGKALKVDAGKVIQAAVPDRDSQDP